MPPLPDSLKTLAARPDVRGALVVSDDGLVVAAQAGPEIEIEAIAALAATAQRALTQLALALGQGAATEAVLDGPNGSTVLKRLSAGASLLVLTTPEADLGDLLYLVRCQSPSLMDSY